MTALHEHSSTARPVPHPAPAMGPESEPDKALPEPDDHVRFSGTRAGRVLRSAGLSLGMLGALVLLFAIYLLGVSGVQHGRDQTTLYATFRSRLAQGIAPVRPTKAGTPVAIVEIPRLKLREVVVEGSSASELALGPGHRRDTPFPGQAGISVLYGRAVTFGGPFAGLRDLAPGDVIKTTTGQGEARFVVSGVNQTIPVPASGAGTLVLVTADVRSPHRPDVVVTAQLKEQAWPGNPALPPVTVSEIGLKGEQSAAVALMLWSQALLIAAVGIGWACARWSPWPTYLAGAPVLVAIVWNVFENIARLLPNTF